MEKTPIIGSTVETRPQLSARKCRYTKRMFSYQNQVVNVGAVEGTLLETMKTFPRVDLT